MILKICIGDGDSQCGGIGDSENLDWWFLILFGVDFLV